MSHSEAVAASLRHELAETREKIADIDAMSADLTRLASELDGQVRVEESRVGTVDINHFAYPTSARAAILRRDNLLSSVEELAVRRQDLVAVALDLEERTMEADARRRRDQA